MKRSPMKRGTSALKRTPMKTGKGRIGSLRDVGNEAARAFYFKHHGKDGLAPCQSCGKLISNHSVSAHAHHKSQRGENVENKLVLCGGNLGCHLGFIHDLNHRIHRLAAEHSPANVVNGHRIDWGAYGLERAFQAFRSGHLQPKGFSIPSGPDKGKLCQGCFERVAVMGGDVEVRVWQPCLIHWGKALDPLFS